MAQGPTIPERPQLQLTANMTPEEKLAALRDHFYEIVTVNRELQHQLASARAATEQLEDRTAQLDRRNTILKQPPSYIGTVEEVFTDEMIVRQHGSNQEILTRLPEQGDSSVTPGTRVSVSDSFALESVLDSEVDARARAMEIETAPSVRYEDIGGLSDQIREIRESVELPLREPERFTEIGIDPPSGVLLHGPPGTGKTMLAKAVAQETDATFVKMAGSELVQKFIGEGARLVRDLFELASAREPAVIFIDEIDAIAAKRTDSKTSGDAEVQRTMMQLLSEMDGFDERGNIRLIAATNRFDMLDRAILRPGRFDRILHVPAPDMEGREAIFSIHMREMNVDEAVDVTELAHESSGATGADIKAICTEAGMFAIRDDRTTVKQRDFLKAKAKLFESVDPVTFSSRSVY